MCETTYCLTTGIRKVFSFTLQVDFDKGEMITLAGTGKQGFDRDGGQQGPQQAISSPWDVLLTSSIGQYSLNRVLTKVLKGLKGS